MRTFLGFSLLLALACTMAEAQTYLVRGDVICASASGKIGRISRTGSTSTVYTAPGNNTVLWDPTQPDTVICGGNGSSSTGGVLFRASFSGGNQVVTSLIAGTGSFSYPVQIGWDQTGRGVIATTYWGQVVRIDVATGRVTSLVTGNQPWGSNAICSAVDPVSGDIYVGRQGNVWRIPSGSGITTLVYTGLATTKLLIDPGSSPRYLYFCGTGSFGRVDLTTSAAPEWYFGAFGKPSFSPTITGVSFDEQGDFVFCADNDGVYRLPKLASIPPTGLAPTLLGTINYNGMSGWPVDCTVVGATTKPFKLTIRPAGVLGAYIAIENAPGQVGSGYLFLSTSTFLAPDTGPFFGLVPSALTLTIMQLPPTQGNFLAFRNALPAPVTLPNFTMAPAANQTWDCVAAVFDPQGTFIGRTNLVRVTWR